MQLRLLVVSCIAALFPRFSIGDNPSWWWVHEDKDCQVSNWGEWTVCSKYCGQGLRYRKRNVTVRKEHNGQPCPSLEQTDLCFRKPCPVRCTWGSWGAWAECSACEGGSRSRSRKVSYPALYGGKRCEGSNYVVDYDCAPNENCTSTAECSGVNMHQCDKGVRCITDDLKCNGDLDCTDTSDERNCTAKHKPCGADDYDLIPNIGITGAGYDIVEDASVGYPLENHKYGGTCDTVYLGEFKKRFRRPYNVQSYRSSADVHTLLHVRSFKNTIELSNTKTTEYEHKISGGVSFTYKDVISFGAKAAKSEERSWKHIIKTSAETDYKYFTITSEVRIGQFRLRRHDLKLSLAFRQRMIKLPKKYDFSRYFQFIADFGTHYYSEGSLGGTFEVVFQYSKSNLSNSTLNEEEQKNCLTTELSATIYGVKPSLATSKCTSHGTEYSSGRSFAQSATKTLSRVRGGSSKTAAILTLSGDQTKHDKYQQWVDSIKHNPAIIDFELSPISNLVYPDVIKLNVERALSELFGQYDPSRCQFGTCRNGGSFVVTDHGRQCVCLCPSNFYGTACLHRHSER